MHRQQHEQHVKQQQQQQHHSHGHHDHHGHHQQHTDSQASGGERWDSFDARQKNLSIFVQEKHFLLYLFFFLKDVYNGNNWNRGKV